MTELAPGRELVPVDVLLGTVTRVLVRAGVPVPDAEVVARVTIDADLAGRPSHGVARLPGYLDKIRHGGIDPAARVEVVRDTGTVFALDGHDGFGQVALELATRMAAERSSRSGVAAGTVRNTNNPGMLGAFGTLAAEAGQVALVACNASPSMPPHGGREARLGTNPLCLAIPVTGGSPAILDMATTAVAKGTIRDAVRRGASIPPGWALDDTGAPTTDPAAALAGLLQPAGGAKGSGLSLMIDLLAGVMAGAGAGGGVSGLYDPAPSKVGAIVITIDPGAFQPREAFDARVAAYLDGIRATPPAASFDEVLVPGDRAARAREAHRRDGVPVASALWRELRALAAG